ncbi:Protein FAR1-RELATED SEQUENCE [Abeliophyllum distichum]|uniref:Protein FAR1-RELATED SEQUENCE n=1 Tax=Abeliophyllum distichum TaxID=126358 RepID=A0ABD1V543_9LAMI
MILAPFVGVNHHRQTIVFACGLLSDESTESFVWLFSKFLEAMPNHNPPGLIITDQDAAISKAMSMQIAKSDVSRYDGTSDGSDIYEKYIFDQHRELTYYTANDYVTCSCRMFEFNGYLCRHMLRYLKKKQVMLLPDKYILRRWTKKVKIGSIYDDTACLSFDEGSNQSLMARHGILAPKASLLVDDACLKDARSNFLLGEFDKLHQTQRY